MRGDLFIALNRQTRPTLKNRKSKLPFAHTGQPFGYNDTTTAGCEFLDFARCVGALCSRARQIAAAPSLAEALLYDEMSRPTLPRDIRSLSFEFTLSMIAIVDRVSTREFSNRFSADSVSAFVCFGERCSRRRSFRFNDFSAWRGGAPDVGFAG